MPLHGYTTDRRPPTVLDHYFAHSYEMILAAWCMLAGAYLAISTFIDELSVSPSVDMLPDWLALIIGGLLVTGGALQTWGLLDDSDDVATGWKLERMGLVLTFGAWVIYTGVIAAMIPGAVLSWTLGLAILTMTVLRFAATVVAERRLRRAIEPGTDAP